MLKVYSKEDYGSYANFQKAFVGELKQTFVGEKATYMGKDAIFSDLDVSNSNLGTAVCAELDVAGERKRMALGQAVASGTVAVSSELEKGLREFADVYGRSEASYAAEIEAEGKEAAEKERLRRERREEAKKRIEAEKRYAKRAESALRKLGALKKEDTSKLFEAPSSHYEAIGWMAKHLVSVRATMPDYMEKWFVGKFGDAERHVVDSRKKTSGGFGYQWSLGLKLTFDEEAKGPLKRRATGENKKVIDSVAFVWDLVENYGFRFGKEQDVGRIKAEVPERYLPDFEKGYAM